MITAEDTARRTPGLANVRISGQIVRRRLRQSVLQARRPVVGPILKQRHRSVRLAWARHLWRLQRGNSSCLVMNPDFSDERYRLYRRRWERFTDQCVYRFGGGSVMV